jgi:HEPN domain-containing protein
MSASEERLRQWIEKADHDLGTALIINEHIPDYSDTLAFHCQQATEKYIKCLLEKNSIPFKKSHDLRYLLDLLEDAIPLHKDLYEKGMKLNAFSVEIRYPDLIIELSKEDREEAIDIARTFRKLLVQNIDIQIDI